MSDSAAAPLIGVLGGTFDPIHVGHLITAESVRCGLGLESVLFVPNREPPHKLDHRVAAVEDRVEMVRLAIGANPGFQLELTEVERPGPSYAIDTLRSLREKHGQTAELIFILGRDALFGLPNWHEPDDLLSEFRVAVMTRPIAGADWEAAMPSLRQRFRSLDERMVLVDVPEIEISSQDIRARLAAGQSIRYLVSREVEEYIYRHNLYGAEVLTS